MRWDAWNRTNRIFSLAHMPIQLPESSIHFLTLPARVMCTPYRPMGQLRHVHSSMRISPVRHIVWGLVRMVCTPYCSRGSVDVSDSLHSRVTQGSHTSYNSWAINNRSSYHKLPSRIACILSQIQIKWPTAIPCTVPCVPEGQLGLDRRPKGSCVSCFECSTIGHSQHGRVFEFGFSNGI